MFLLGLNIGHALGLSPGMASGGKQDVRKMQEVSVALLTGMHPR